MEREWPAILPAAGAEEALKAPRQCARVKGLDLASPALIGRVTMSIGAASLNYGDAEMGTRLTERADIALHASKYTGPNRVQAARVLRA